MALQHKVMSLFYIYLVLSVDPIQASRIKATKHTVEKAQETQELVREMQKALDENHMEELFIHNASSLYIGETWATCAGRKADFERRSVQVKARYEEAQEDGTFTTIEAGWVVLKARSLATTVSNAAKQGCEWVQNASAVDMTFLGKLMNETGKSVPCREQAMAAMEKKEGEPTFGDVTAAMSMLFSSDCKPHEFGASTGAEDVGQLLAAEEKEENEAQQLAAQFKAKQGEQSVETAVASLIQKVTVAAQSNIFVTLTGLIHVIIGMVVAALLCVVALALWAIVLGLVYCLFRAVFSILLKMLDSHEFNDTFGACSDRWLTWFKSDRSNQEDAAKIGAAVCLLTTLLGTPIAGVNNGGLWFNTNWGNGYYWNYHHYGYWAR